ncbi:MAG TPA: Shedu immune nuclease family protein [Nostocaceae cyanobacterium]|nr:Shedu immune nuclease family protein [Nostocaceae cyanobacterium]
MENNTIPPVDYAPPELQGELIAMQKLGSEKLLEIVKVEIIKAKQKSKKKSQLPQLDDNSDHQPSQSETNNQLSESDKFLFKRAYAMALLYYKGHSQEIKDIFKKKDKDDVARAWTKLVVSVNSTIDDKTLNDQIKQFDCVIANPPFQTKILPCIELLLLDNLRLNKNSNELDRNCKCFIPVMNHISDSVNKAATEISKKFEVHRKSNTKSVFRQVFIENTKNTNHTWEALQIHRDRINPSGNISNLTTKLNKKVDSPDEFNRILELLITSREISQIVVDIIENKSGNERDIEAQKLLNRIVAVDNLKNIIDTWKDNKNNSSEEFWHKFFEENSVVLGQVFSTPVTILGSKAYVGGKKLDNKGGKYPDYLMIYKQTRNTALIEIKTPETQLLFSEYRSEVYSISREITGAINQLLTYRDEFLKDYYRLVHGFPDTERFYAFNPQCILIAGNAKQELCNPEQKRSFELYRNSQGIQIVTYDEVFEKLDTLVNLLEGK